MKIRFLTFPIVYASLAMTIPGPAPAQGCIVYAGKSETVSVEIGGGKSAEMMIRYYEDLARNEGEDEIPCEAWISVPLSAFPTVRLATRPADVAGAIRHVAREWEMRECRVHVLRRDDLEGELPADEQCIVGDFRFEGSDWWASSSEKSCDELDS